MIASHSDSNAKRSSSRPRGEKRREETILGQSGLRDFAPPIFEFECFRRRCSFGFGRIAVEFGCFLVLQFVVDDFDHLFVGIVVVGQDVPQSDRIP